MEYSCECCDMSVKGLICGKCGADLISGTVTDVHESVLVT